MKLWIYSLTASFPLSLSLSKPSVLCSCSSPSSFQPQPAQSDQSLRPTATRPPAPQAPCFWWGRKVRTGRECPSSASSRIGMRQKATPPPRFALNEDMTQGGMASKTETLWPLSETLWAWKPWSVRSKRHGLLMTLYHLPRVALHYLRENSSWSTCKVPSGGKCSGPEADATWCNPGHTSTPHEYSTPNQKDPHPFKGLKIRPKGGSTTLLQGRLHSPPSSVCLSLLP